MRLNIKVLLAATLFVAAMLGLAEWIKYLPQEMVGVIIMAFSYLAVCGIGLVQFSLIFALAILLSRDDSDRNGRLWQCASLAIIGLLSISPVLIFATALYLR